MENINLSPSKYSPSLPNQIEYTTSSSFNHQQKLKKYTIKPFHHTLKPTKKPATQSQKTSRSLLKRVKMEFLFFHFNFKFLI